ncbi:hypothetical protein [Burkholderia vietnamiensis]|uniref:hypothetical protein n=1 Tax=Burkholderia vietnamiensis TaxID=60552 RepID=UPI00264EEC1F|nr:hypothetical protein [Burkholderia vietnamiensis]MDN7820727.1 hypothetical protein [Burkholderia vietnamiensis]
MANNNFKPFAAAGGANVMAQADYEALAALLTGFQSGTAQSAQLNKVWRQSSIMSAVLAQFIVDLTGQDAIDDGTTATLLANLKMAVQAQSAAVVGQARNLAMSVTVASSTATLNADEIIVGSSLGGQKYLLKQFSKTINLGTTGAGGMDTGSAPASGFVAIYAIYNPTTGASALLATNATSAVAPNVYGGANKPSGYTASALVSVWPTNGSSQFIQAFQRDRRLDFQRVTAATSTSQVSTLTAVSVSSIIPKNAVSCSGWLQVTCHAVSSTQPAFNAVTSVASDATGLGYQQFATANPSNNVYTYVGMFRDVPVTTQQTVYWSTSVSGGSFDSGNFQLSGYSL